MEDNIFVLFYIYLSLSAILYINPYKGSLLFIKLLKTRCSCGDLPGLL